MVASTQGRDTHNFPSTLTARGVERGGAAMGESGWEEVRALLPWVLAPALWQASFLFPVCLRLLACQEGEQYSLFLPYSVVVRLKWNARPIFMNHVHFASLFASCPHADVKLSDVRHVSLMHRPRSSDEALSKGFLLDSISRPWDTVASLLSLALTAGHRFMFQMRYMKRSLWF